MITVKGGTVFIKPGDKVTNVAFNHTTVVVEAPANDVDSMEKMKEWIQERTENGEFYKCALTDSEAYVEHKAKEEQAKKEVMKHIKGAIEGLKPKRPPLSTVLMMVFEAVLFGFMIAGSFFGMKEYAPVIMGVAVVYVVSKIAFKTIDLRQQLKGVVRK